MSNLGLFGFGPDGWGAVLLAGAAVSIGAAVCGLILASLIGAAAARAKLLGGPIARTIAQTYTTVLRGVPDLLVIFLLYFGSSSVLSSVAGFFGYHGFFALPGFIAGVLAIGIVAGALMTEVFRGAFLAVKPGEIEAAKACGMSTFLRFRRIIAPLTLRHALPSIGNVWLGLLKGSSLLSATGVAELMRQTQIAAGSTRLPFDFYLAAALIYIALAVSSGLLIQAAERRYSRGFVRR
ncbi:ABC transporter permease [Bosea sp. NPDC003192]|uniref:ABC transporter permease n=1 Tax=unclassified Bosea (in: a-proteobacteria) TaxID=2653178 RepID=UPI002DDC90E3|nr:ABC transporter permease subunit [Bosea sp. (in: a-proteobacteria)]HEV2512600.1 ABC transporter permease subunit [Bosea sp. (in: a-proteobacteria)]